MGNLRAETYLTDVTLITDDNSQITAHKLVLSVTSDYFQSIFKNNTGSNLLICLDGVSKKDLTRCLEYMYNGEVEVYQDNLESFLEIAQRFKIKGLLNDDLKNSREVIEDDLKSDVKIENEIEVIGDDDIDCEDSKIHTVERQRSKKLKKFSISQNGQNIGMDKNIERLDDGSVKCTVCGKISTDKSNMRVHIETHVEGLSYSCSICSNCFKTKDSLRKHMSKIHK